MAGCTTHAQNGHISTSGLKPDVTITVTINTSNDVILHKDVPFGGPKNKTKKTKFETIFDGT